jgi:spermidine/putrescine-binding protein
MKLDMRLAASTTPAAYRDGESRGKIIMATTGRIRIRSNGSLSRRRFVQGLSAAAAFAATGLPSPQARAATNVAYLGWQGYDNPLNYDDFAKKNDITLSTTYIGNSDEIVTKLSAGGVGQIDIVTPYMGYVPLLVKLGVLEPIDASQLPNLDKVMPLFRNNPNINIDGKLYAVPFTWGSGPMMYDPAVFKTPPDSWFDLLKPEFAGKVGMMDGPLGNMIIAAILVAKAPVPTLLTADQLKESVDFLIKLKKQSRLVALSWGDLADAMARGDVAITFNGWEAMKKFAADKGKVIEYNYPKEGTFAWLDNYCIVKNAPHMKEAYLLANQVISDSAQKRFAESDFQAIVNKDAIASLDAKTMGLYPYDNMASFGNKARFCDFPPLKPEGNYTTWSDWLKEYQRFKTA